jgi:hypothetical protein
MSTNRLRVMLVSLLAVFAVSAVASGSASAACYKVVEAGTGSFEQPTCAGVVGTKEWVKVSALATETPAGSGQWCAKVEAGEPSRFSNNTCTTAHVGTGEFAKVYAEPVYTKSSSFITAASNVRYTSMWSRLWDYKQKLVIVCERDKGTGTVTTKGADTVAAGLAYTGCTVHEAKLNTTEKQYEEGAELRCVVAGGGGAAGEILLKALKSKLVFKPNQKENELLVRLEPETAGAPFVELVLSGTECALAGTFKVTGSVLGWAPRVEPAAPTDKEEALMNDVLFETTNFESAVTQRFPKYELLKVETEDVLSFGANPAAYESTEQVELEPVGGLRGAFGASL